MSRARSLASLPSRDGDLKPGTTAFFAMSAAPAGWLKANGALVSRAEYAALFAVIGTTYGAGDGSTTFALPDLRGEFLRGLDDGRGVDAARGIGTAQGDRANSVSEFGRADGSPQSASVAVPDNGDYSTPNVQTGTNAAGTSLGLRMRKSGGETRPSNVALLACIKT
jgi:microcystin-dependent protein